MVQPLWKRVWRPLKELKLEVPYSSAVPLSGIYPPKVELNKIHAPSVHIYLYERTGAGELARLPVRLVLGLGAGAPAAGIS